MSGLSTARSNATCDASTRSPARSRSLALYDRLQNASRLGNSRWNPLTCGEGNAGGATATGNAQVMSQCRTW